MYDKLEVTSQGRMKINGTQVPFPNGYDALTVINDLEQLRLSKLRVYKEMIERIKDGDIKSGKEYEKVVGEIRAIDNDILKTIESLNINKSDYTARVRGINDSLLKNTAEIKRLEDKQRKFHVLEKDVKDIVKLKKQNKTLWDEKKTLFVHTFVEAAKPASAAKHASAAKLASPKTKKQAPEVQVEEIKARVKDLLKRTFQYRNKQECLSRTKSLFMSKEQIIEAIEKQEDLKKLLPSNYKKLSKDALCEQLFEKI
jgi:hypothetical protein